MAWQDIFGSLSDDCGNRTVTTSSRRGKVSRMYFDVENFLGGNIQVMVDTDGPAQKIDTYKIKDRIQHFETKENPKKVQFWEDRYKYALQYNKEQQEKEFICTSVILPDREQFQLDVWGHRITKDSVKMMNLIATKKYSEFFKQLEKQGVNVQQELDRSLAEEI